MTEAKLLSNIALIAALSKRKTRKGSGAEYEDRAFNDGLDNFVVVASKQDLLDSL